MKKKTCLVLLLALLFVAGCSRVPPVRVPESYVVSISRDVIYTLESAFEDADLVAVIRIGDWLGESDADYVSFFRAQIEKTFKGDAPEKIVLVQDGKSERGIQGFPLFTAGNELLVFLKIADNAGYENAFWIEGSYATFFDVARDGKDTYYLDRYGLLGDSVEGCDNLFFDSTLAEKLYAALAKQDPLAKDRRYHFIFSASQLDAALEKLKTGE